MRKLSRSQIVGSMSSFLFLIVLVLAASPALTQEISSDLVRVADLTPNGRSKYGKMLHQELNNILDVVIPNYVDEIDRQTLLQYCIKGVGTPRADGEKVEKVFSRFIQSFDDMSGEAARKQMLLCADSMLKALGPTNEYVDANEMEKRVAEAQTNAGIGIEFAQRENGVYVVRVLDDSAAQSAGIRPGDLIMSVNDVSLTGLKLEECRKLLVGKIGSGIKLLVSRPSETNTQEITVNRVTVDAGKINSKLLANGITHLTPLHLTNSTLSWLATSIREMQNLESAHFRGAVLDLRACRGGLLPVSVGVSAAFLTDNSPVMETKGRTKDSKLKLRTEKSHYVRGKEQDPLGGLPKSFKSFPLVVLTGPGTSGGCEVIAAALQDHKRATIVGAQTAKQGMISTLLPVLNAPIPYVKLTTSRIFRTDGRSLTEVGVSPDIPVEPQQPIDLAGIDPALDRAVNEIEEKIKQTQ